jgi:hypothetical protein
LATRRAELQRVRDTDVQHGPNRLAAQLPDVAAILAWPVTDKPSSHDPARPALMGPAAPLRRSPPVLEARWIFTRRAGEGSSLGVDAVSAAAEHRELSQPARSPPP